MFGQCGFHHGLSLALKKTVDVAALAVVWCFLGVDVAAVSLVYIFLPQVEISLVFPMSASDELLMFGE
jgi:hypothetical protein